MNVFELILQVLTSALACLFGSDGRSKQEQADYGLSCVYDGVVETDSDWYGFIANVTIIDSGRMTFRVTYPANRFVQSILLYSEEQVNLLDSRMSCWQKEDILKQEDDEILRLTPQVALSGCQLVDLDGVRTYVCQGGRSFLPSNSEAESTCWYIAVSNCASLYGLKLTYHLEVYGHVGKCGTSGIELPAAPAEPTTVVAPVELATAAPETCVIEGQLNTSAIWYGFLANLTLNAEGDLRYRLSYPYSRQIQNVILYNDDDINKLNAYASRLSRGSRCWGKIGLMNYRYRAKQIVDLSYKSTWNGCVAESSTEGRILSCKGSRHYVEGQNISIAVSNCRSRTGLVLTYRFEVDGCEQCPCS